MRKLGNEHHCKLIYFPYRFDIFFLQNGQLHARFKVWWIQSVEVGFATDVTRGSSFSPRASGTRVIYAFADDEHKSRSYLTHMNLLFLQTSFSLSL